MGTTAQKLTYLNDTKQLLKDSINSIGGNITLQTTFRQYVTELDSIYASLPKVSGSGSNISLSPTKKGRITSQINGDTLQDGTPTPTTPVEIQSVTGLQKVDVVGKNFAKLKDGIYIRGNNTLTITNNSLLTINTNITGANTYLSMGNGYTQQWSPTQAQYVNINDMKLTPNGGDYIATIYSNKTSTAQIQFTIITSKNRGATVSNLQNNTQGTLSISLESDEHIKDIGMWMSGSNVFDDYQVRVQIERGTTTTTYEAYNGNDYTIHLGSIELFEDDYITGTPSNWSIISNYGVIQSYNGETITTNYISTTGQLTTGAKVVYELDTPTTTPITDTTLINDLNNFYYAMSKNGETNISVDGNLPIILDVSALKGEE